VRMNTKLHREQLRELREKVGDLLFPDDTYLPISVKFPERDIKNAEPKYMMHVTPSHQARIAASKVGDYVHDRLFG